jgi:hypothetical protein
MVAATLRAPRAVVAALGGVSVQLKRYGCQGIVAVAAAVADPVPGEPFAPAEPKAGV